jgi:hypothetical protein
LTAHVRKCGHVGRLRGEGVEVDVCVSCIVIVLEGEKERLTVGNKTVPKYPPSLHVCRSYHILLSNHRTLNGVDTGVLRGGGGRVTVQVWSRPQLTTTIPSHTPCPTTNFKIAPRSEKHSSLAVSCSLYTLFACLLQLLRPCRSINTPPQHQSLQNKASTTEQVRCSEGAHTPTCKPWSVTITFQLPPKDRCQQLWLPYIEFKVADACPVRGSSVSQECFLNTQTFSR